MVASGSDARSVFVPLLLLDPSRPWNWPWLVHIECYWASFGIFFDPQGVKIFVLLT